MNVSARMILDDLCNDDSFRVARLAELAHVGEFSEELRVAIEEKSAQQRWGCVCILIWVVQRFPNQSLVPILTKLLDAREDYAYLEAVVDALIIMPDGRAVESLKRALKFRVPGDDLAFHFNKKVITALIAIGSDTALEAVSKPSTIPTNQSGTLPLCLFGSLVSDHATRKKVTAQRLGQAGNLVSRGNRQASEFDDVDRCYRKEVAGSQRFSSQASQRHSLT